MKHTDGTIVEVTTGSFKGKRGVVQTHRGLKVVVLEGSGVVLHGVNDKNVKKA